MMPRSILESRELTGVALGDSQFDRSWLTGRFDRILLAITFAALTYYSNRLGLMHHSYFWAVGSGFAITTVYYFVSKFFEKFNQSDKIEQLPDSTINKYVKLAVWTGLVLGIFYVLYAGYNNAVEFENYTMAGWSGMIFFGFIAEPAARISLRKSNRVEMQP